MKYLLSTGRTTDRIEYYIIDLFKLYLTIYPGDIPGAPQIGFDFNLGSTLKVDLVDEVKSRASQLVSKLASRFEDTSVEISVESIEIVDETLAKLVVNVNKLKSDEILVSLFND